MEWSLKSLILLTAVLLTGLSAGLFYAWQVSVIPGTRKLTDIDYLQCMQFINRAILNPAFFLVFMGSPLFLLISSVQHYKSPMIFWYLLIAGIVYLIGTFGITAFGNVPLNDMLDMINLTELHEEKAASFRKSYEEKWNRLHLLRTIFAVCSFLTALIGLFTQIKI